MLDFYTTVLNPFILDNVMVLIADYMKRISFEAINKMSIAVESFFVLR